MAYSKSGQKDLVGLEINHSLPLVATTLLWAGFLYSCNPNNTDPQVVNTVQKQLESYATKTILLPYTTPDGKLRLPFTDGTHLDIEPSVFDSFSDNGREYTVVLPNKTTISFRKDYPAFVTDDSPLEAFRLNEADNSYTLDGNLTATISGNAVTLYLPYLTSDRTFTPQITTRAGRTATLRAGNGTSARTDFSNTVIYDLSDSDSITVNILTNTLLPEMRIVTEDHRPVLSKEDYLKATLSIRDNPLSESRGELSLERTDVQIKGRGNSTWNADKKPYKLKFDKKVSLLGEAPGKQWVLLAGSFDPTLLRNDLAFRLSQLSRLEWTPCSHFVDLFLNDRYLGVYQLSEQLKVGKDRVNLPDGGYLLEIDRHGKLDPDDVFFSTVELKTVTIKDPEVEKDSQGYNTVSAAIRNIEKNLMGEDFLDPQTGYKTLMDIESFAAWLLLEEITRNADSDFGSSCYMNWNPEGKLKMGPAWDFDQSCPAPAVNNHTGWGAANTSWYRRMLQDPDFTKEVRKQFEEFKNALPAINTYLDQRCDHLMNAAIENNIHWTNLTLRPYDYDAVRNKFKQEKDNIKEFLRLRIQWLDQNLPQSLIYHIYETHNQ